MAIVLLQWRWCVLFCLFVSGDTVRTNIRMYTKSRYYTPSTGSTGLAWAVAPGCISLLGLFHPSNCSGRGCISLTDFAGAVSAL